MIVVICLAAAAGSASAQRGDSEQALQAVFTSASGKAAYVAQLSAAAPETLGQQTPCPANRPFAGEWPENVRCYYDAAGNLDHWAAVHTVTRYADNFWTGGKSVSESRVIAGYPAVLQKQRQYNEWVRQNPGLKTSDPKQESGFGRGGDIGSWHEPAALPETGRLTMGTLLIPYYKSRLSYDSLYANFIVRCGVAEGGAATPGHPCAKPKFIEWNHSTEWMPNYPNADMAEWGRAIEALAQARLNLYARVEAIAVFQKKMDWDPLDCFGAGDRRDCSVEALLPADAAALDALTQAVVAKIARVREIEDAHAEAVAVKPLRPVEWIDAGGGFEMSKSPVTVEQYAECVQSGQCTEPGSNRGGPTECNWGIAGASNAPVNCVSWRQANEYARFKRARLPSPEEYEYAATNGGRTRYPWGDDYRSGVNYIAGVSLPVCSYRASDSAAGICDLLTDYWGQWSADAGAAADMDSPIVMGQVDLYKTHQYSNPAPNRLVMEGRKRNFGSAQNPYVGFRLARSPR